MFPDKQEDEDGDVMAGDRRIARPDTALPDWHNPDTSYRPIPIVWFTAAFLVQSVVLLAISVVFSHANGILPIAFGISATWVIGRKTWDRGMKNASERWKAATIWVLLIQLAFIVLGASDRL
ncbi:hypothetical protein [Altererythrobacter lutimaris]|uniref:Uncharacterized protein n=1 Tax=Altererythrobacter lutimaris TaxID=2743979 RepID=A0A850HAR0_9SPHN|nr:hypothetical protein [Altererythrobacter lutimaris]NVE94061.1 hypothetical protein [Altererythrobacter lutimaris]